MVTTQNSMQQFLVAFVQPMTPERLQASFEALVAQQDVQLEQGEPVSRLPLAWVALAEWVGLVVDLPTGRIVGGPCREVVGL
jgi:hypothetical protein